MAKIQGLSSFLRIVLNSKCFVKLTEKQLHQAQNIRRFPNNESRKAAVSNDEIKKVTGQLVT